MINPFGKQPCPMGGWRKHCGPKCMFKHYDDPEGYTVQVDTAKIAEAIRGNGYRDKLRTNSKSTRKPPPPQQQQPSSIHS